MKERLTHNFGLKLLSLFLATLLWLVVINSQDPVETVTFDNIPVTIINEDSLTAKDKIPEVVEGDTITVVVEARRKICDVLTKDDIVAIADFEKISVTDAVPIEVSINGYSDREAEIVRGMNQVMKLRLEDSMSKDFRVKISTTGAAAEGCVIGDMIASPNMITLTGSSTQISKIKEVVLVVDIDGVAAESKASGMPVIYDLNGDIVSANKVTMSSNNVSVTIPVLKTKKVRILVETVGEPAPGYEVASVSYQPDSVLIAGTPSELALLGSTLTAHCVVTDQSEVVEENIDIATLWSSELSSLRLVDEEKLAITVTMREYEEVQLNVDEEDLQITGLAENLIAEVTNLSARRIRLLCKESDLQGLTLETLAPYIELEGLTEPGTYTVAVAFDNMGELLLKDVLFAEVVISQVELEDNIEIKD